jgi:hypothetical protein
MLIGTFSGPPAPTGGSSSANSYSTIQELLVKIPDNIDNLIKPKDIRDSVFTLWERISDVQVIASQSATSSSYYTNTDLVPLSIGGISAGSSFPGTYSMQEMWDLLLYPYISPVGSFTSLTNRQYGAGSSVTLSWSVTKNTNPITSIVVDGLTISPTGNSQTGTKSATGSYVATPPLSTTNTYIMTFSDGVATQSSSTTLTWMNKRYWGSIDLSTVEVDLDLTTYPGLSGSVGAYISDAMIISLDGASANGQVPFSGIGNELSITKSKTYVGINGNGNHLVFAFPSACGIPVFSVNGNPNSAFTKVKSDFAFVNENSWSGTLYDVWVSNTAQGSPLNIIIS